MRLFVLLALGIAAAATYAVAAPNEAPRPAPAPAGADVAAVDAMLAPGALPPAHPPIDSAAEVGRVLDGIVAEVLEVDRYTYVRLTLATKEEAWAAVSSTKLTVGARVRVREEVAMRDFTSPTLHRTFPSVSFGSIEP